MRTIVEGDIPSFCDWLGVKLVGPFEVLSPVFTSETLTADLLVKVSPDRLLHVEYVRTPEADMYVRMLAYRARIMRDHPNSHLTQCAIVLGGGRLHLRDDLEVGFYLGLRVVYLRLVDRQEFLGRPSLSALAELAKGDQATRAQSALAAIRLIRTLPEERQSGLFEAMINLATISLDPSTIDLIRRETGMTIDSAVEFYDQTEIGQELRKRGLEQGVEQGLEQGLEQGVARTLTVMLRTRFGDDPRIAGLAAGLAHQSNQAAAISAAIGAQTLDELAQLVEANLENRV